MDIISYNQFEIDSNLNKFLSRSGFDKNPKMTRYISKLSDQYEIYKESYNFPTIREKYKGEYLKKKHFSTWFISEFNFASKLHYVKISFDTPKFEMITKDRAAKWTDQLSAIGGTMGLLTGFSIISGVEIIYFALKIALDFYLKFREQNFKDKSIHQM